MTARPVFVLTVGCYEEVGVAGVFATPEAAMAAYTPERAQATAWGYDGEPEVPYWEECEPGEWWSMAWACADVRRCTLREV